MSSKTFVEIGSVLKATLMNKEIYITFFRANIDESEAI
jgi:hypothetical protein